MADALDPDFLRILACPESRAPLIQVGEWLYSTDPETRRRYAIRDGIPNLLIEESEVITPEEFERVVRPRLRDIRHGQEEETGGKQAPLS